MFLEHKHLTVIVFFGEEHGSVFLMIAVPKLVGLLKQLLVCALVVLVVKFEGLHKISMNHFGLCIDRFDHIVEATFNVN